MIVTLKGFVLSFSVISLLEIGRHPMTVSQDPYVQEPPSPFLMFVLSSTVVYSITLVCGSPYCFHLISHNSRMSHLYLSISCTSSSNLPTALRVLTSHVPTVMSSLPLGLTSVAYLTFKPWCKTGNAVLLQCVNQSGIDIFFVFNCHL